MHQGKSYLVSKLDLTGYKAYAHRTNAAYYTAARDVVEVTVISRFQTAKLANSDAHHHVHCGPVEVVARVWGYRKMWLRTGKIFEMHEFDLPPLRYETQGAWIDLSGALQDALRASNLDMRCGIHGINHLICKLVPLHVICSPKTIATEHVAAHYKRPQPPRLLVFDQTPGGLGIAEAAFSNMDEILESAKDLLFNCKCEHGCLGCIIDPVCTGYNGVLSKESSKAILRLLLPDNEGEEEIERPASPEATPAATGAKKLELLTTPQTRRVRAVNRAMGMGRARVEQLQITPQWSEQMPNHSEGMK
mmetsp:Transcript_8793/g.22308  ORF Transcript_8793/g.22308 Transcript_8793/m.22308 type:complete len:305 (+) Transcript_8793:358-1272(+)